MNKQNKNFSPTDKLAAIFLALGEEISSQIITNMEKNDVLEVCNSIVNLKRVHIKEIEPLISEFYSSLTSYKKSYISNNKTISNILKKSFSNEYSDKLIKQISSCQHDFEKQALNPLLSIHLKDEHPQTIALLLAVQQREVAIKLIKSLPFSLQADVLERIAKMKSVSPLVLSDLQTDFKEKITKNQLSNTRKLGGQTQVAEVLKHWGSDEEKNKILKDLANKDKTLAIEIEKKLFLFEDILLQSDEIIRSFLSRLPRDILIKSLRLTNQEVIEKIYSFMSKRQAEDMNEELKTMKPIKRTEVEEAQNKAIQVLSQIIKDSSGMI